jgi:4-hydroxybenzoate polyprenyltransferase
MGEGVTTALNEPARESFRQKVALFAEDIKLHHTVFALPFALLSTFLAAQGVPKLGQLGLILLCMVSARTVAMAANRLIDARLDAANPRTARRPIPSGRLSRAFVAGMLATFALAFIGTTALFAVFYANPWPFRFSVPVLGFVVIYPLLKRFTTLCHYYLGAALALAPICAWVAIRGSISDVPCWMASAVLLWTAGFDIIYASQDYASDVANGIFSVPAALGIRRALWVARLTHLTCFAMLVTLGVRSPQLGLCYFIAVGIAGVLLLVEHSIVDEKDLSKANVAFFMVNGVISLLLGTMGIIDVLR